MMPQAKEHPLTDHHVVTNSGLALGETVYVIDWIDRLLGLIAPGLRGTASPDAVLVRDRLGRLLVPAAELPAYDPVTVGYVS